MDTMLHVLRYPFQHCRNARGSSAVEVAITILPFFLAFMGVIEFGVYYFHQHTVQAATHDGIRVGLLGATLDDGGGGQLNREESIIKAIKDRAGDFISIANTDIQINPLDAAAGDPNNAGTAGQLMQVQVNYTHEFVSSFIGGFFGPGNEIQIRAVGTYRNEDFLS